MIILKASSSECVLNSHNLLHVMSKSYVLHIELNLSYSFICIYIHYLIDLSFIEALRITRKVCNS